jgi:hypothetical protein
LTEIRATFARKVLKFMKRLALAEKGSKAEYEAAQDIVDMGNETDQHAGMVRIIYESMPGGLEWKKLKKFVERKRAEFEGD